MLEKYNQNRYQNHKSGDPEIDWLYKVTESEAPVSDIDAAWETISKEVALSRSTNKSFPYLKIAASIALIAVSIFAFNGYFSNSPEMLVKQSLGKNSTVTFPDGSRAVLNENSEVAFLEEFGEIREVNFSGEAYFDIQKSEKPFVIKMGEVNVRVLGTAFNLISTTDEIQVLVAHGLVALEKGSSTKNIQNGELGILNLKSMEISVDTTPPSNIMSWRNGKFSFQEATLEVVTEELAKYYDVTFKVPTKLKNCKITANFNNESLKEVLGILEAILSVSITEDNSIVKIKGKGCQ